MAPEGPDLAPPSRLGRYLGLGTPPSKCRVLALIIVLAGALVANAVPDGPASRLAHAQTADSSLDFAENGTVPVGTFFAYDQDGDTITWSLGGPDAALFSIDDGMLAFK